MKSRDRDAAMWRDGHYPLDEYAQWKIATLVEAASGAGRVLEIGAGDGRNLQALTGVRTAVALDHVPFPSQPGFVRVAASLDRALPFRDASFDAVVAFDVLEHLLRPDAVLDELARVLRPGGVAHLAVPNAFHLANRITWLLGNTTDWLDVAHLGDARVSEHVHRFSLASFRRLVGQSLEVEEQLRFAPSSLKDRPRMRWLTTPVARGQAAVARGSARLGSLLATSTYVRARRR